MWIVRFENSPGNPAEARLCGEIRAKWESVFRSDESVGSGEGDENER